MLDSILTSLCGSVNSVLPLPFTCIMTSLSCSFALFLINFLSPCWALVTSEWHTTQRVLMFSSLHSPVDTFRRVKDSTQNQKSKILTRDDTSSFIDRYYMICMPSISFNRLIYEFLEPGNQTKVVLTVNCDPLMWSNLD